MASITMLIDVSKPKVTSVQLKIVVDRLGALQPWEGCVHYTGGWRRPAYRRHQWRSARPNRAF